MCGGLLHDKLEWGVLMHLGGWCSGFVKPLLVVAFFLVLSSNADAYTDDEKEKLGPGIYPAIGGSYEFDDNIYRVDEDQVSDELLQFKPSLTIKQIFRKRHTIEASYFGDWFRYKDFKDEDFDDHYLDLVVKLKPTKKLQIKLSGDYASAHELRGSSGTRLSTSQEPDSWWGDRLLAEIMYGKIDSKNQVLVNYEMYRRRYTNNAQEPRSRDRQILTATYFHNRKKKTRFLLEGGYKTFDYFDKSAPLDLTSIELSILLGIKWDVTDKTSGEFKIGYLVKDIEDPELPDYAGWSMKSEVAWKIRTYSELTLELARMTKESPHTIASYYVSSQLTLDWDHEFSEKLEFIGDLAYLNDDYKTISDTERNDNLLDLSAKLIFKIRPWLHLTGRYLYTSRNSTFPGIDYKANIFSLSITMDSMEKAIADRKAKE